MSGDRPWGHNERARSPGVSRSQSGRRLSGASHPPRADVTIVRTTDFRNPAVGTNVWRSRPTTTKVVAMGAPLPEKWNPENDPARVGAGSRDLGRGLVVLHLHPERGPRWARARWGSSSATPGSCPAGTSWSTASCPSRWRSDDARPLSGHLPGPVGPPVRAAPTPTCWSSVSGASATGCGRTHAAQPRCRSRRRASSRSRSRPTSRTCSRSRRDGCSPAASARVHAQDGRLDLDLHWRGTPPRSGGRGAGRHGDRRAPPSGRERAHPVRRRRSRRAGSGRRPCWCARCRRRGVVDPSFPLDRPLSESLPARRSAAMAASDARRHHRGREPAADAAAQPAGPRRAAHLRPGVPRPGGRRRRARRGS